MMMFVTMTVRMGVSMVVVRMVVYRMTVVLRRAAMSVFCIFHNRMF